jgi:hypothetical protein
MRSHKDTSSPEVAPAQPSGRFVARVHEKTGELTIVDTKIDTFLDVHEVVALLNKSVTNA